MIRVALIDGPLDGPLKDANSPARTHARIHAEAMEKAIQAAGAPVDLLPFPVFDRGLSTSEARLCQQISAAVSAEVDILHLSLGLAQASRDLRQLLDRATAQGLFVIASSPARGARPVWPAAHPKVIAVQGDARCGPQDWSALDPARILFGACPRSSCQINDVQGASLAAAYLTGHLAQILDQGCGDPLYQLAQGAAFFGRERRSVTNA